MHMENTHVQCAHFKILFIHLGNVFFFSFFFLGHMVAYTTKGNIGT